MQIKITHIFNTIRLPLIVSSVILLSGTAILFTQNTYAEVNSNEIKDVVLKAFNPTISFGIIKHTEGDRKKSPSANLSNKLNHDDVETSRIDARKTMSNIFDPNCVSCAMMAKGIEDGLTGEENGYFRVLDGGLKDINWQQLIINRDTASVTVSVTSWSKIVSKDEFGNTTINNPTGGSVKIFSLKKYKGHWVITNFVIDQVATSNLSINQNINSSGQTTDQKLPTAIPKKQIIVPSGGTKQTN